MTQPNHHPLPKDLLKALARLMQLHLETDPHRLAQRFGVTAEYVRRQWRERHLHEMASLDEALDTIRKR